MYQRSAFPVSGKFETNSPILFYSVLHHWALTLPIYFQTIQDAFIQLAHGIARLSCDECMSSHDEFADQYLKN